MAVTNIRGSQILNNTVQRQDLDTSTVGQAVVTKLVQGSGITLSSTGADSGTGDVTVSSPDVVSTDAGNIATLGSDNHILVPQSQIWSARLRSFNALGNPTFEIDQRNVRTALTNPSNNTWLLDRWRLVKALTATFNSQLTNTNVVVPGTNFIISGTTLLLTLTASQASLGSGDILVFRQMVEGPQMRELIGDKHSISVLVNSSIAPLRFSTYIRDVPNTQGLTKLATISNANTWTLISFPNLPVWPSGNFSTVPGVVGYECGICLAAGSGQTAPATDIWTTPNVGAPGMDNWCASAVNSTFQIAFIQHEPGAQCSTPIDCPFTQNLDDCLRYFQKSYQYTIKPGTVASAGSKAFYTPAAATGVAYGNVVFPKIMAKLPTFNLWSPVTGTASAAALTGGGDATVSGALNPGDSGFDGIVFTAAWTAGSIWQVQYAADTGW